jgi:putative tryptophan/tyrosine transport system substrate-binding protein
MRRRQFIAAVGGAAAWPVVARGQQPTTPVIGVLSPEVSTMSAVEGLRAGLRELGYVDARNVRFEYRWAQGRFDRLPDLAAELVRLNVDVIIAFVTQASLAAKRATATIPVVMVGVADPVGVGLIASLSHPGGNVTGTSSVAADIVGKQLELLKETTPKDSRVAVLWNPANSVFQSLQLKQAEASARTTGVEIQLLEARAPNEFDAAFAALGREAVRALLILTDPLFAIHTKELVELSANKRLAAITGVRAFADAGGLMAYGPSYFDLYKRAAAYVDKILKGAKPADLPVEQPTKFEFIANLKTAKTLGIDLPKSLLARADEVIE